MQDFLVPTIFKSICMKIELKNVIPLPLREKPSIQTSEVWNRELTFQTGEWIKIMAPSGTGKTTLVHSLYGLRSDHSGSIYWQERDIKKMDAETLASMRQSLISIVFQDLRLFPSLSAWENIELKRTLQQPYHSTERIQEMAVQLGVEHILEQKAGICSYGEQQRIAIIRALSQPFEWLMMDEPFSHLDKNNAEKAAALIAAECTQRKAGLLITDLHPDNYFPYTRTCSL